MERVEREWITGWEFSKENERAYHAVELPHDWAVDAPFCPEIEGGASQGYRDRWGIGWYRKRFQAAKKPGVQYALYFDGIYENSTIWVNGRKAGGWKYGYSSFRIDITPFLAAGENEIRIRVDNSARPSDRWYSGAGIYRKVWWQERPYGGLQDEKIDIQTVIEEGRALIRVGYDEEIPLRVKLADQESPISPGGYVLVEVKNPRLWSAENPYLYDLVIERWNDREKIDSIHQKIGLRQIEWRPREGLWINGKHTLLRGVCLHQDVACCGIAVKKELWRDRLRKLKKLGCNALRLAHHPFSREFLDLCDEMGFYVYEECFDKWTSGAYGRYFGTEWKRDLDAMILRDRNRPSIIMWGVGNEVENQGQVSMLDHLKDLVYAVKDLDGTRPVTYAMNPHFKRESGIDASKVKDIQKFVDEEDDLEIHDSAEKIERIRKIGQIVDVISCNYQEPWYEAIHEAMPDKLILGTEVYPYFLGDQNQLQNFTVQNPSLVPLGYPYVVGSMIWTGYDYLGEAMQYPSKGWSGSLLRSNGVPRGTYYQIQSYWTDKPMVHFAVLDYSMGTECVKEHWDSPPYLTHWDFPQYLRAVVPYRVVTNCEEVALYLNDKRYILPSPADCPNHVISGFLPYTPGTVRLVGYRKGRAVCEQKITTPAVPYRLQFEDEALRVFLHKGEERLLHIRVTDQQGFPCIRAEGRVSFRGEGALRVLAVDNGSLLEDESYHQTSVSLYQGGASVLIRRESDGQGILHAECEGLQEAKLIFVFS